MNKKSVACEIFHEGNQIPFYAMIELSVKDYEFIVEKAALQNSFFFIEDLPKPVNELTMFTNFWEYDKKGNPIQPDEKITLINRDYYEKVAKDELEKE